MVLVDTSVWIEFFKRSPAISLTQLELFIEEGQVVTCWPVKTEVLSGDMSRQTRSIVSDALNAMISVDPDWNSPATWKNLVGFATGARRKGLSVPGIIDRMILLAAKESGAKLWTLDKKMGKLAQFNDLLLDIK